MNLRFVVILLLLQAGQLGSEPVPVRFQEGSLHGFLVLRSTEDKVLATGDVVQIAHGDRINSHLHFKFRDGSVDDERSEFSQRGRFKLISDHLVQKGPSFPKSVEVALNAITGQVKTTKMVQGKEEVEEQKVELPTDLVNGMLLNALKNITQGTKEIRLSYLALAPKPRVIRLDVKPDGDDVFLTGGARHKAARLLVKVDLGGVAGVVAPMIGKQPSDITFWFSDGPVPAFVRSEGPLFFGGPIWRIEMVSPTWTSTPIAGK